MDRPTVAERHRKLARHAGVWWCVMEFFRPEGIADAGLRRMIVFSSHAEADFAITAYACDPFRPALPHCF